MDQLDWLAARFEEDRPRLRAIAYRMLGSPTEADDAVQETWLRLSRSEADRIANLRGWLTTAVGRTCVDMLRARTRHREVPFAAVSPETVAKWDDGTDPEQQALMSDSVGLALLTVLDTLTPHERLAFVLHDVFDVPFDEIASIVGCSTAAARQMASRGRRRVKGAAVTAPDLARQRAVVDAFLAAANDGDFDRLITLLDPDVTFEADDVAVRGGAPKALRGAAAVARSVIGRTVGARPALVDGSVGVAAIQGGRARGVVILEFAGSKIVAMRLIGDLARIDQLDISVLDV